MISITIDTHYKKYAQKIKNHSTRNANQHEQNTQIEVSN